MFIFISFINFLNKLYVFIYCGINNLINYILNVDKLEYFLFYFFKNNTWKFLR